MNPITIKQTLMNMPNGIYTITCATHQVTLVQGNHCYVFSTSDQDALHNHLREVPDLVSIDTQWHLYYRVDSICKLFLEIGESQAILYQHEFYKLQPDTQNVPTPSLFFYNPFFSNGGGSIALYTLFIHDGLKYLHDGISAAKLCSNHPLDSSNPGLYEHNCASDQWVYLLDQFDPKMTLAKAYKPFWDAFNHICDVNITIEKIDHGISMRYDLQDGENHGNILLNPEEAQCASLLAHAAIASNRSIKSFVDKMMTHYPILANHATVSFFYHHATDSYVIQSPSLAR
jgi:hypothetical protein